MSTGNDRIIELYRQQFEFIQCPKRYTAFIGGIGSGKTFAGAVKLLHLCNKPEQLMLVVAPTYPMLRDATYRMTADVFGEAIVNFNKGEMRATINNGTEILFRSADQPDRLRGPNLNAAWIDEAALCPPKTWEIVIGRLRADGTAGPCFITSTPKGRNWLYERAGNMQVYRAHTRDNPYNAPEFVESLEASYVGKFADQELAGEFVGFDGLVYEQFSREIHVQDRTEEWKRVVIGVDEGYTNPAVLLAIGVDNDGRAHVIEELYRRRMLQGEVVEACRQMVAKYNAEAVLVDPSAAGLIADMESSGIPAMGADNTVTDGIQAVKARLAVAGDGQVRLTISSSCPNTISEFESYSWRERSGNMLDEPEKINDHAMDGLRYATQYIDNNSLWWIAY